MSDEIPVEPDEIESGTGPSDTAPSEEADDLGRQEVTAGAGLGDDVPAPPLSSTLTTAAALLPPEEEASDDEIPPTPEEADLQSLPLAQREALKLSRMTPEQKERYDGANAEIMSHPAVQAFREEEERRVAAKGDVQAAFVKAWKAKNKA